MTWLTDWRDADLAEQCRQEQIAYARDDLEPERKQYERWAAMVARQLD